MQLILIFFAIILIFSCSTKRVYYPVNIDSNKDSFLANSDSLTCKKLSGNRAKITSTWSLDVPCTKNMISEYFTTENQFWSQFHTFFVDNRQVLSFYIVSFAT